jgi:hypothetical protein
VLTKPLFDSVFDLLWHLFQHTLLLPHFIYGFETTRKVPSLRPYEVRGRRGQKGKVSKTRSEPAHLQLYFPPRFATKNPTQNPTYQHLPDKPDQPIQHNSLYFPDQINQINTPKR